MREIKVVGYPKSGTTWVARLFGDALNCPVEGEGPEQIPLAAEGKNRPRDKYVVTHSHNAPPNHSNHFIYVLREPKDVCVSAWKYWNLDSLDEAIDCLVNGSWPVCRVWKNEVSNVFDNDSYEFSIVYYWELSENPMKVLREVGSEMNLEYQEDLHKSIERQSFKRRKIMANRLGNLPYTKKIQRNLLRKGIVGDWKNHFTIDQQWYTDEHFRPIIEELGLLL